VPYLYRLAAGRRVGMHEVCGQALKPHLRGGDTKGIQRGYSGGGAGRDAVGMHEVG
jgi:hypothetical protein